MNIFDMKKEDFDEVAPIECVLIKNKIKISELKFMSVVIIPNGNMHDSGWQCMDIVLVNQNLEPIGKVETASDVLHLDGIGGRGYDWLYKRFGHLVEAKGWKIDCLPCSYLRLFNDTRNMYFDDYLCFSDLEIYSDFSENKKGE